MREMWFPIDGSDKVVGRFVDTELEVTQPDKVTKIMHRRPALEARVAGNSTEISFQVVKDFNREQLIKRCPAAWAYYEANRDKPDDAKVPTISDVGIKGTPLETMNAFNNERVVWFKSQGIQTVEQLAALSDSTLGNLGMGARGWRKKAIEHLASAKAA
jgi:hypothetical protein